MRKLLYGLFVLSAVPLKGQDKPNFVFIIADDVSRDDLGCYGNTEVKTPNIDRIAAAGIRFTNVFLTASSSSPSRNSIITGRYPHNTGGAELHTIPPDHMVSFPELLRQHGYYSVQAGKFHMGDYARRGFDLINENNKLNGDGGEELWVKCLQERPPDKPFFMWFAAYDAHRVNGRGLRTPFIVHWPEGIGAEPKVCSSLVSSIDIAPTILDVAGISVPDHIQGYSFAGLLIKPHKSFRKYVFGEHNWHDYEAHERVVRTKDYLYILNSRPQFPQSGPADAVGSPSYEELDSLRKANSLTSQQADIFSAPRPKEELYSNNSDPDQFDNLTDKNSYRKKLVRLRSVLQEWMKETGDNIPENLTKDWYLREPGYVKTKNMNIRGEPVDAKFNATRINNKGKF